MRTWFKSSTGSTPSSTSYFIEYYSLKKSQVSYVHKSHSNHNKGQGKNPNTGYFPSKHENYHTQSKLRHHHNGHNIGNNRINLKCILSSNFYRNNFDLEDKWQQDMTHNTIDYNRSSLRDNSDIELRWCMMYSRSDKLLKSEKIDSSKFLTNTLCRGWIRICSYWTVLGAWNTRKIISARAWWTCITIWTNKAPGWTSLWKFKRPIYQNDFTFTNTRAWKCASRAVLSTWRAIKIKASWTWWACITIRTDRATSWAI